VHGFLGEGHKVKITIMFRGREMQHPELGRRILDRVAEEVAEVGRVEIMPKQDGRNMTMVLGPDKKAQAAAAKKLAEAEAEAEAEGSGPSTNGAEPSVEAEPETPSPIEPAAVTDAEPAPADAPVAASDD
jgi:translation initiation factor IF-3